MTTNASKVLKAVEVSEIDMTADLVETLYHDHKLSMSDLVTLFNTTVGDLDYLMNQHGISKRDRSEASRLGQEKRHGRFNYDLAAIQQTIQEYTTGRQATLEDARTRTVGSPEQTGTVSETETHGAVNIDVERSVENRDDGVYSVTEYTATIPGIGTEFTTTEETQVVPNRVEL